MAGVLVMPYAAQAFGFGAPVIKSHLGEPLRIYLPISLNKGEVLSQIFIDLAKPDVYKKWGLQLYMDVSQLHLVIHHEQKNHPYVEILSYDPMSMALVSFVLEAKDRQHHYYKQIKVMLDPVSFSPPKNHDTQHEKVMHLSVQKSKKHPGKYRIKAFKPVRVEDPDWARTWRYGPVRSGDSLSTIAYRLRKDKRYSNHAVMRALYRLNADAFDDGNINRLKSGVFLNVPHAEQLKILLSAPAASSEVKKSPSLILEPVRVKQGSKLHYVGHISAKMMPKTVSKSELILKQAVVIENIAAVKKRLNAMYKKSMASHIRMDGMDLALGRVNVKVDGLEHVVKQVNQDQLALQIQVDQLFSQYDNPWLWRGGLLVLFLLNAMGLLFLYIRLKKKSVDMLEEDGVGKGSSAVRSNTDTESMVVNSIENHIYDIERAIDHKDYTLAQRMLDRLQGGGQVDNPRLSALKVCLYHARDQIENRDSYVRQRHDGLNEMQWRVFCDRIPSNVWQALVLAQVVAGLSYDDDMESRVRDIDDTVIQNPPHLIVNNENSEQTFESMEDIGFDGIPTVTDGAEHINTLEVKKESDDALNDKPLLTQVHEEKNLSEFFMEQVEDDLVMTSEQYEVPCSIENQEALDFNFADLSLEDDTEDVAIESGLTQDHLNAIDADLPVMPMLEEAQSTYQNASKVMEDESFNFEFNEEPLLLDDLHAVAVEKLYNLEAAVAESDDLFEDQDVLSESEIMHDSEGKVL
ncbi:MAG: FimV/HubP family polar landmark protein [Mariprofundaceae bacterium]|nr:FimV/HubP family polar landmark protein [Mariprofundaceae bacterium]